MSTHQLPGHYFILSLDYTSTLTYGQVAANPAQSSAPELLNKQMVNTSDQVTNLIRNVLAVNILLVQIALSFDFRYFLSPAI